MKKYITLILALALVMSLSVPAFAEGETVGPGDKVEVGFTFEVNEPKYTVEIPAGIELKLGQQVSLPVTVSGGATETLEGRKIVITLEDATAGESWNSEWAIYDGVTHSDDLLIVENSFATGEYYKTLNYFINPPEAYNGKSLAGYLDQGRTLLEFAEDGTKNLGFQLAEKTGGHDINPALIYPNSEYKGHIVFGIKLEW